jgi:ATP-dependent DNA ligase
MFAWDAGFIAPCLPTKSKVPPSGPEWVHEIKHDGYRLMVRREGGRVQLLTRRGYNWTGKYPRITEAARRLKADSFLIDGEAVCCGEDGIPDFDRLHTRRYDRDVFLYGFDLLHLDGEDYRQRPLHKRKARLQRLLAESHSIRFSEHLQGDGPTIFEHICKMGLEGIVSKRRDLGYESGRSTAWVKVLNPGSAAIRRYREGTF